MGIRDWWNSLQDEPYEQYTEKFEEDGKLMVRIFDLKENDADEITEAVNTGKIIALINSKNNKDGDAVKNIMIRVKEATEAVEGNIVGLPDKWFLVTPKEVGIFKKQE